MEGDRNDVSMMDRQDIRSFKVRKDDKKKKYTESNSRKLHWVSHKKIIQWFFLEPPCKFVFLGYVVLLNYYLTFHKWKLTGTIFVSSQILQQKKNE